jgi:hypothetical protein
MLNRLKTISTLFFVSLFWFTMANAEDCATDPKACSIIELCKEATITKRGYLEWNFDALSHVAAAKDAGLSCGVDQEAKSAEQPSVVKQARFTKNDFLSFSELERRQIQYALKQLGFYTSSVDGLWGRGTDKAVNDFVLDQNITANVAKTVYKSLTLAVDISAVTTAQKKKPAIEKTTLKKSGQSSKAKVCKLDSNPIFEQMFSNEKFVDRTLMQFDSIREFKVENDRLLFGSKAVKPNSEGKYKRYIKVLCVKSGNMNWSRCGSFTGYLEVSMPSSRKISGKLVLPWEWTAAGPPVQTLNYSCSGF